MGKKILAVMEQSQEGIKKSALELLTAANKISSDCEISAFMFGDKSKENAAVLADYGVSKVFTATGEGFSNYNSEVFVDAIKNISENEKPDYIISSANPLGKDLMARLSAKLQKSYISDVTDIKDGAETIFVKPIFAGKILTDAKISGEGPYLVSLRPNVLPSPDKKGNKTPEIIPFESKMDLSSLKAKFKELKAPQTKKIDLQEASIIVSGGRGIKEAKNFEMLSELASVLGGAVGASRAAVDSEFATEDMQVGQTGKTVNPSLYIACGISGAIQHLAGMRTSKVIVAINKDADAPIFKYADYGIVGDIFKVVPELTKAFKELLKD